MGGSLGSGSLSLGKHTQLPSTDNLPLSPIAATADSPRSSVSHSDDDGTSVHTITEADVRQQQQQGQQRQQEQQRQPMDDPFNPPEPHEQQHRNPMLSPFSDPEPYHGGADETTALVGSEQVSVSRSGSQYPIVVITSSSKPPPPRPLGLPPPKAPPPPIEPPMTASPTRQGHEDDVDDDKTETKRTRWWHEWLCGCGEGPDRGGERQVCPRALSSSMNVSLKVTLDRLEKQIRTSSP